MKTKEMVPKKVPSKKRNKFEGYCFAKLNAIGTKSEGPLYFLQLYSGKEVLILKKAKPWQNDPFLHSSLGEKIVVYESRRKSDLEKVLPEGIDYGKILNKDLPLKINIKLKLRENTLWINKLPGPIPDFPPKRKKLSLRLLIQLPFDKEAKKEKSAWTGECLTSRLFDFWIDDPKGKTIWKWSSCLQFLNEPTKVVIPDGVLKVVKVPWTYFPNSITQEGRYTAHAKFIASDQEIKKPFWIKFAE